MQWIDTDNHPIEDVAYVQACKGQLGERGALTLRQFFTPDAIKLASAEAKELEDTAFFSRAVHNVYLASASADFDSRHIRNREVISKKGLIADDQIAADSVLRAIYGDDAFRTFLEQVLGTGRLHPYPDKLSTIVISVARENEELGWHFDTSSFSVTMLLQASEAGGMYEFVSGVRNVDEGDMGFERATAVVEGEVKPQRLDFSPGDLVVFRGQNSLHRVTPVEGPTTRSIAIFAYNEDASASMSDAALTQFFGRIN